MDSNKFIKFGLITVSDSCYDKSKQDTAGPALSTEILKQSPDYQISTAQIVQDCNVMIVTALQRCVPICDVIFTIGGTGFGPRDVTPEATKAIIEREAPGIMYALISKSLEKTEFAMLSRSICGIKDRTIIINFPGSKKAAVECFDIIKGVIPHAVDLVSGRQNQITQIHHNLQNQQEPLQVCRSKVKVEVGAFRKRASPYPMVEVAAAQTRIFNECSPTVLFEYVPFEQSLNRVLAEDIKASEPIPPFRASMKDGYAVISADGIGERRVVDALAAGDKPDQGTFKAGEVVRISTGAPVPACADAVVQIEDTTLIKGSEDGQREETISINTAPTPGQDIRNIGSDIAADEMILQKFESITSAHIGVLATLGKTEVKVFRKPSVAIISTGNELRDARDVPEPGKIIDSNKIALIHLLKRYGFEASDGGIAKDNPDSVKSIFEKAFEQNDIVISSGGVSMGEFDLIKSVLETDFNALIHFGRVNMKPGKPTTFASLEYKGNTKLVFGLPGNPVSCSVTCLLFVVPALRFIERNKVFKFPEVFVTLTQNIVNSDERPEYVRVMVYLTGNLILTAVTTGDQISSRLNSMVGANGLMIVPKTARPTNNHYNKSTYSYTTLLFDNVLIPSA